MNLHPIESDILITTYPSGETHAAWACAPRDDVAYYWANMRTWTDLMTLVTLDNAASRINGTNPTWFVPYFPFARDDRRRTVGDADTLFDAINILDIFDLRGRIIIADPHSYATEIFNHIPQKVVVEAFRDKLGMFDGEPLILIPDEGATKKAYTWIHDVPNSGVIQGKKVRDPHTGMLSGFDIELTGNLEWKDLDFMPVVMIDDICDGGGTFLGLAKHIRQWGVRSISLGVTHGLFTNPSQARQMRTQFKFLACMSDNDCIDFDTVNWMDVEGMVFQ